MGTSTTTRNGWTRTYYVDVYGIIDLILADASNPNNVPDDADVKVTGADVFFRLGDSTLLVADIVIDSPLVADISVVVVDVTSTYTVTLGGTDYDYVAGGGDDEDAILAGIAALIDGVAGYKADVLTHGANKLVRVRRSGDHTSFTVAVSATATGELSYTIVGTKCDPVLFGEVISSENFQRDLDAVMSSPRTAVLTHIAMKTRAGETAIVIIKYSYEVPRTIVSIRKLEA